MSDLRPSPFRAGFNRFPGVLACREDVLDAADEAIASAALDSATPTPLILVGPRGVGKTVLLTEIARRAGAEHGWPRLQVEVAPAARFTYQLIAAARQVSELLGEIRPGERLCPTEPIVRAHLAGIGGEVHLARTKAELRHESLMLTDAIGDLATRLLDRRTGIVLTVDELQLADRGEVMTFGALLQRATGSSWPFVVLIAGLPHPRWRPNPQLADASALGCVLRGKSGAAEPRWLRTWPATAQLLP